VSELELLKKARAKDILLTIADAIDYYLKWVKLAEERPLLRALTRMRDDPEASRAFGTKLIELDRGPFLAFASLAHELGKVGSPDDLMKKPPEERMAIYSRLEDLISKLKRALQR